MTPEQIETMRRIQRGEVIYSHGSGQPLSLLGIEWAHWRAWRQNETPAGEWVVFLSSVGDMVLQLHDALTAERAAHAETLLVLAAEQGRLEGAPSDNMRINALCDLVDEVLNDTEAHGDPGRGTPVGSDGSTVGGLVQLARLGNPAGVAFIKSLLRGRVRVSFNRR